MEKTIINYKKDRWNSMTSKYRKVVKKSNRVCTYVVIGILFVLGNSVLLIDSIITDSNIDYWRIIVHLTTFCIECLAFLYCVIQDIKRSYSEWNSRFVFQNDENGIPFVDREELLKDILTNTLRRINDNAFYYTKNIRYGNRNGKTAFAKKLCHELQRIKDNENNEFKKTYPRLASKIGNIFYVNYANLAESFSTQIKTEFTYVKGKKNIVVVDNSYDELGIWTETLADKDIFFIFLNYNTNSDDALFFADDKIKELLIRLKRVPAFNTICIDKSQDEITAIAAKLGTLSNNNIGTIIDLLSSNEFNLLLETDKHFVDFYFALKHGKYQEATKLYEMLPQPPTTNKILNYKMKYEKANLTHFLGDYKKSNEELELLLAELCNDYHFIESSLGKGLYMDIILLQSHVYKHQGYFDKAALILNSVAENKMNIRWLRAHFSINILQLNDVSVSSEHWMKLLEKTNANMNDFKRKRRIKNSDFYFFETYYPIIQFYSSNFDKRIITRLIDMENRAISYYEKKERRYLTNCYFIKAEFYRIVRNWKAAEEFYSRCYDIYCHNGDKDILYLVAITCKCLQYFEQIDLNIPFNWNVAIEECKQREEYMFHNRLISQIELACLDREFCKQWLQRYRITINPIP